VADCVYDLACCFVSVIGGRTRSHFGLVSRCARTIDVGTGCTMRLAPSTERGTNGRVLLVSVPHVLAALLVALVASMVGACAIAGRPAEGAVTPYPRILGSW
jgi:hypothetical protein